MVVWTMVYLFVAFAFVAPALPAITVFSEREESSQAPFDLGELARFSLRPGWY